MVSIGSDLHRLLDSVLGFYRKFIPVHKFHLLLIFSQKRRGIKTSPLKKVRF
jgi:hypothetical protein